MLQNNISVDSSNIPNFNIEIDIDYIIIDVTHLSNNRCSSYREWCRLKNGNKVHDKIRPQTRWSSCSVQWGHFHKIAGIHGHSVSEIQNEKLKIWSRKKTSKCVKHFSIIYIYIYIYIYPIYSCFRQHLLTGNIIYNNVYYFIMTIYVFCSDLNNALGVNDFWGAHDESLNLKSSNTEYKFIDLIKSSFAIL